mgnify:CR=1 FL=1
MLVMALVWQPIAAPLHIAAGAVVLAALTLFAYFRVFRVRPVASSILLVMRLAVIGVISVLLMGPSREEAQPESTRKPKLSVLVDTSESMRTEDCDGASRLAHAASTVLGPEQMLQLQEGFRVDVRGFDERVHPVAERRLYTEPTDLAVGRATYLAESVTLTLSELRGRDEGDVLLIVSDGRDTEDASVQPAAALAESKRIPIYAVAVGGDQSTTDAALLAVPMQESLLPGEPGAIMVKLYQSGLDGTSTTLTVTSGDEVTRLPVEIGSGSVVELQVPIKQDEPGQYQYEVAIDVVGDEAEVGNNRQTVFCEVMERRLRVLVLEGQPFWDTKFLAQSLRKDERVELTQITQLGLDRRETIVSRVESGTPQVPQTPEEWSEYDVVILGRGLENVLDREAAERLVGFVVDGGGHVIFSRGPACSRDSAEGAELANVLRRLEPVVWGNQQMQQLSLELTPSGRTSTWLSPTKMGLDVGDALSRLSGFEVMQTVEREKPGTLVLARAFAEGGPAGSGVPAVTSMNYGRGTVIGILGEGLWKWSLLPPESQDLRGFYDTFWSNLVRWLALGGDFPPGQQVALQLSRTTARLGDEVTVDIAYKHESAEGATPRLQLTGPGGEAIDVAVHELPGAFPRYRATILPTEVGVHEVELTAPGMNPSRLDQRFNVYDVNLERLQTAANPMPLRILAEHSGGAFLTPEEGLDLSEMLSRHLASLAMPPKLIYIWDRGLILTLLLVWMGVEWITRRMVGLW